MFYERFIVSASEKKNFLAFSEEVLPGVKSIVLQISMVLKVFCYSGPKFDGDGKIR